MDEAACDKSTSGHHQAGGQFGPRGGWNFQDIIDCEGLVSCAQRPWGVPEDVKVTNRQPRRPECDSDRAVALPELSRASSQPRPLAHNPVVLQLYIHPVTSRSGIEH